MDPIASLSFDNQTRCGAPQARLPSPRRLPRGVQESVAGALRCVISSCSEEVLLLTQRKARQVRASFLSPSGPVGNAAPDVLVVPGKIDELRGVERPPAPPCPRNAQASRPLLSCPGCLPKLIRTQSAARLLPSAPSAGLSAERESIKCCIDSSPNVEIALGATGTPGCCQVCVRDGGHLMLVIRGNPH